MQSVSSRIWTRVAVSISYNDNDYTTGTSNEDEMKLYWWSFLFYFNAENVLVCVSSLFSNKISTCWIHKVHAVWLHMDKLKSSCWHRVIGSPILRDFHTILKLTVLQMQTEKKAVLISVCGMETFSLSKDLITPDSSKRLTSYPGH